MSWKPTSVTMHLRSWPIQEQGFHDVVESLLPDAMQEHEHAPADLPGFVPVGAVYHGPLLWNMPDMNWPIKRRSK